MGMADCPCDAYRSSDLSTSSLVDVFVKTHILNLRAQETVGLQGVVEQQQRDLAIWRRKSVLQRFRFKLYQKE